MVERRDWIQRRSQVGNGLATDCTSDLQQQECRKAHMTKEIPVTRCTTFQRVRNILMLGVSKHDPVSLN